MLVTKLVYMVKIGPKMLAHWQHLHQITKNQQQHQFTRCFGEDSSLEAATMQLELT